MQYFSLLALPLLVSAAPTLVSRAGGPSKEPLPSTCDVSHVQPSDGSSTFEPTQSYDSANLVYSYPLIKGGTSPDGTNDQDAVNDCLESCYGFGDPGSCKSVWTGHGVNYNSYGSTQKVEFLCKMYGTDISSEDLGPQQNGDDDSQAKAMNVGCQRSE